MVAGSDHGKAVSWIVDAGSDFPPDMMNTILSWNTGCLIRENKGRLTTRAWNGYSENEKRGKIVYPVRGERSNRTRLQILDAQVTPGTLHAIKRSAFLQDIPHGVFIRKMHSHRSRDSPATRISFFRHFCTTNICLGTCTRSLHTRGTRKIPCSLSRSRPGQSQRARAGNDVWTSRLA